MAEAREQIYPKVAITTKAELGEKDRLTWRYHQAFGWLETNVSSLGHWRRVVEQMEALIQ
jgi:hypothetical protein